jgi:hypothetical protein
LVAINSTIKYFYIFKTGKGGNVRPFQRYEGKITATGKRGQISEAAIVTVKKHLNYILAPILTAEMNVTFKSYVGLCRSCYNNNIPECV